MENLWFKQFKASNTSKVRLFCFPHAGGSAETFKPWAEHLPSWMELYALQLPGRGSRFGEPLLDTMATITDSISTNILPLLSKPYIFLGHSLGGSIAFELTRKLRKLHYNLPNNLFVIARESPSTPPLRITYNTSDEELMEYLREQSGTEDAVLQLENFAQLFLPMIRCDLKISETYHESHQNETPIPCPITAMWSTNDPELDRSKIEGWKNETSATFTEQEFDGNHFFLHEKPKTITKAIVSLITNPQTKNI